MKVKRRVAQCYVDLHELARALRLPADTKILGVDPLNTPLGFIYLCIETKKLPRDEVKPDRGLRTVLLRDLQDKR